MYRPSLLARVAVGAIKADMVRFEADTVLRTPVVEQRTKRDDHFLQEGD